MPPWATTLIGYIGKGLSALFAGATAALGSIIAVLIQIGEGAAFSDIELVAWLASLATGLAAFGVVLGINARQSN
jgi:hypothetical protein